MNEKAPIPVKDLVITRREVFELVHVLNYAKNCAHGTDGHNRMILLAKLAEHKGFALAEDNKTLVLPNDTVVVEKGV